jgi:hypothetical protein
MDLQGHIPEKLLLLAILAYALLCTSAPLVDGDTGQYQAVAQDLKDGQLNQVHLRTPGYPLLRFSVFT